MVMSEKVEKILSMLYTDLIMLKKGQWVPDEDSINASIDNVIELSNILDVKIIDLRNDEECKRNT